MAEFNFVSTLEEIVSLSAFLFESECVAIPVRFYKQPCYDVIRSTAELNIERSKGWHTYLFTKREWGTDLFEIDLVDNIHVGKVFAIGAKRGPPNIQVSYLDRMNTTDNNDVVSGFITTYHEFWPQGKTIKAPPAVRSTYTTLTNLIRKKAVRHVTYQVFWITKSAKAMIDAGTAPFPEELLPEEGRPPRIVN